MLCRSPPAAWPGLRLDVVRTRLDPPHFSGASPISSPTARCRMPAAPTRDPLAPTGRGLSPEGPRPADLPPPGGPDAAREAGGPWPTAPADSSGGKVDWTPIDERMPPEGTLVEAD